MTQTEQIFVNDIVTEHRERMLNLKKYYPFFQLSETSFSWFMEGRYDNLDMGYIMMAVLRFFIEENNFQERDVTYPEYAAFMRKCLERDFGLKLGEAEEKQLVDYIFDKLKNDGRPFSFQYYDPVDRVKRVSRIKLLESRIEDGTVWYSISPDGIEFYLDTKEIKDESKISVEQLLLEKMIDSKDFKGGTAVVAKINEEVKRLWRRKNQVLDLLTTDVFSGTKAYQNFFETGMKWFEEEQRLFAKNKELIEAALKRAENEKISGDADRFYRTANEIYRLDTELKVAMNNHSELIRACTDLGIKADAIIRKAKLSRLRSRFDFKSALEAMLQNDRPETLSYVMEPFFGLNVHKTFNFGKLEDLLSYHPENKEVVERVIDEPQTEIVFDEEAENRRFMSNARTLFLILLEQVAAKKELTLKEYNSVVADILSTAVFQNGDYYTFLVHLCGKTDYCLTDAEGVQETFLDELIRGFLKEAEFAPYLGMRFSIELAGGVEEELELSEYGKVTNFTIRSEKSGR